MSTPGVLRIYNEHRGEAYVSQWAAPERVIPMLAQWIEECRAGSVVPEAWNYSDFVAAADQVAQAKHGDEASGVFRDDHPAGQPDPDGTEYRYVFRADPVSTASPCVGWVADLTVLRARPRPDREPLMTVWHQIQFSDVDTTPIHLLAYRGVAHIIKNVKALDRPQYTGEALQEYAEAAAWHRTRAGAA